MLLLLLFISEQVQQGELSRPLDSVPVKLEVFKETYRMLKTEPGQQHAREALYPLYYLSNMQKMLLKPQIFLSDALHMFGL